MIVKPARVAVDGHQTRSLDYDDIYFDTDGPAEVRRVFTDPAALEERFARQRVFTVAEFGFGTGLNFLVTMALFLERAPVDARLRFISFEKHPLRAVDVAAALRPWQSLHAHSDVPDPDVFAISYPPPYPGWHRRFFCKGRVELSVFVGDISAGFADLLERDSVGVDAWFLDGFAPVKNAEMWHEGLLSRLQSLTCANGTVTTFSAAGFVRRTLENNGFAVKRIDARPHKRHTLAGVLSGPAVARRAAVGRVVVRGAGFAGCAVAAACARKGIEVDLVDPTGKVGATTSAIPAAILHARLFATDTPDARLRAMSYTFSQTWASDLPGATANGAIQIPDSRTSPERLATIADSLGPDWAGLLEGDEVARHLGFDCAVECGVVFARSLTIDGPALCRGLADHPNITLHRQLADRDGVRVLATGSVLPLDADLPELETAVIGGQVDSFRLPDGAHLPTTVVADGYLTPESKGSYVTAGSTYEYRDWDVSAATRANRHRLHKLLGHDNVKWRGRFRGRRTVTSDRTPIVGRTDAATWVSLGHGSSGTTSALFAGERIASEIAGELSPATADLMSVTDPFRFRERQKRRPNPFSRQRRDRRT